VKWQVFMAEIIGLLRDVGLSPALILLLIIIGGTGIFCARGMFVVMKQIYTSLTEISLILLSVKETLSKEVDTLLDIMKDAMKESRR